MKKIIISILIFLFAFSVLAKTDEIPASGLTPDSSFYFLKAWKESIQTFFTFGAENKAKQYLHLAEVRLTEYQKMVEKGKTEIAEKTLEKYQNQLSRALQKTEELKNKGKDIKDLSQKIEDAVTKHLEILQENLQKVPEQAKKGIENAIENSKRGVEKVLETRGEKKLMCGGIAGKTCPTGYICKYEGNYPDASGVCISAPTKKSSCKDVCGDGICQEIVCMATNCPCAETKESCPQDCAKDIKKITDKKSCETLGGRWGRIGLSQKEECNLPTSDAGKECLDSSECEGSCIAELYKEDLNKLSGKVMGIEIIYTKGRCTAWRITVGCQAFVRDGKVEGILCVD